MLVFCSPAFSCLLHNEYCGTKSGTKANINLDQEFDIGEFKVRLPNSQANTYQIFKSTVGMTAASAYKQGAITHRQSDKPSLEMRNLVPVAGATLHHFLRRPAVESRHPPHEHLMALTREYTYEPQIVNSRDESQ